QGNTQSLTMTPEEVELVARRLVAMGAPTDFILVMLLCSWLVVPRPRSPWQVIELAVLLGVQACFGQLVMVLATVCSTWVAVNAGTSRRSILVPQGCVSGTATRKGNKMAVRCGLLMLLCCAMNGTYILENPRSSMLFTYLVEFFRMLRRAGVKVFQIHFWMQSFASSTPKRTTLVSNGKRIGALFNIACSASSSGKREHEGEELVKTCRAYVDGQGRKRYQGTPALKETQTYTPFFAKSLVSLIPDMLKDPPTFDLEVDMETPLPDLLRNWSSWEDAELGSVLLYLRGSKCLKMPEEYKAVFPSFLDVGPSLQNRKLELFDLKKV
ncbi:unnamed protein product, partial [Durusdinium trenchii]